MFGQTEGQTVTRASRQTDGKQLIKGRSDGPREERGERRRGENDRGSKKGTERSSGVSLLAPGHYLAPPAPPCCPPHVSLPGGPLPTSLGARL